MTAAKQPSPSDDELREIFNAAPGAFHKGYRALFEAGREAGRAEMVARISEIEARVEATHRVDDETGVVEVSYYPPIPGDLTKCKWALRVPLRDARLLGLGETVTVTIARKP